VPKYLSRVNRGSTFRPKAARLMDQVRGAMRHHHYGHRTADAYPRRIRWFIKHNGIWHLREMGNMETISGLCRNCRAMRV